MVVDMRKKGKGSGVFLAAALICSMAAGNMNGIRTVEAAGPEKVMQLKTKGIEGPTGKKEKASSDTVYYTPSYIYKENWNRWDTAVLPAPVACTVADTYRYDRNLRKRVMDLTALQDGSARAVDLAQVAFISAAKGGKESYFEQGQELSLIPETESVNEWKFTLYNPYDAETNPTGMVMPDITNIRKEGAAVAFDYDGLDDTGNCYLSAVVLTKFETEVVAYERLISAEYGDDGSMCIHWPGVYDDNEYVLKVFAEKYNGDYQTDYISKMVPIYQGFDDEWEDEVLKH